ncbi:MAG TPA: DUF2062 domain-containing protein [Flavobacterium sp.]|nr:DUF2062 domain-containing protein [Flavobacterium sp.]
MNATVKNNKTWCVIIPTYNNAKTLKRVIEGVLSYTSNIVIINDGSTDDTAQILQNYKQLTIIGLPQNKGKGNALQIGFKEALKQGFDYTITIDSDGQHYPKDIPVFLEELNTTDEPVLLIGSRNMQHESVPKKSSFGNRFSNFWFWFETGIKLSDTQSGYRLYPLKYLPKKLYTNKFEFEIEVIVRTAWKNVAVKNIPIRVLYDPNERVSHFRPFRDFTRISILNTVLVTIALLYIKPRDFFRSFKKKSFKQFLKEDILQSDDSKEVKALSVALGSFIGIAPLWGLQSFLSIFLAVVFRWNKVISFAASNISIPPMIPVIVFASLWIGSRFVGLPLTEIPDLDSLNKEFFKAHLLQYLIGSIILATVVSLCLGIITYAFLIRNRNKK